MIDGIKQTQIQLLFLKGRRGNYVRATFTAEPLQMFQDADSGDNFIPPKETSSILKISFLISTTVTLLEPMCVGPCDLWPSINPTLPCLWNSGYSDSLLYFFLPLAFCKDAPLLLPLIGSDSQVFFFWLWPSDKPSDSDINQATNTSQSQEHREGFFFQTFLVLLGQKQPAILQPTEEVMLLTGSSFPTLKVFVVLLFRQNKLTDIIIMLFQILQSFF